MLSPSQAELCSWHPGLAGRCWEHVSSQNRPKQRSVGRAGGWNSHWESLPQPALRHTWALSSLCNPRLLVSKEPQDDLQKEVAAGHTETWSLESLTFLPGCAKTPQIQPGPGTAGSEGGRSGAGGGGTVTGSAAALPSGWAARTPPAPARARRSSGSPRAAPGAGPARSAGSCPPGRTPSPAACRTCGC